MTKYGNFGEPVWEYDDDPRFQSPAHQVSHEEDSAHGGTYRKCVAGIKPARFYGSPIGKPLSDRAIDRYLASGFYQMRRALFQEKKREKRLIWSPEKQDFELR